MSIWDRARTKAEELLGRAEQVYGESHGDAAAKLAGEAHIAEAEEQAAEQGSDAPQPSRPDDEGLAGAR